MTCPPSVKSTFLRYVANAKGDDLERAERVFREMSHDERNAEWGCSGRTPNQILQEYREFRREWQAVRDFVDSL